MDTRIKATATAGVLAGSLLIASAVGATAAPGAVALVAGSYTYTTDSGGHRSASIAAVGTAPLRGTWEWQKRHGPVTCLVVLGNDAWLAGPGTTGPETGVFIHVRDGGSPGRADDLVTAWGQDPGQPFEELQGWCEGRATHVPLFALETGDVTVKELR